MAIAKKITKASPKDVLKPMIKKRERPSKKADPLNFKNEDWYLRAWNTFSISKGTGR